jgi:hypothetical protein
MENGVNRLPFDGEKEAASRARNRKIGDRGRFGVGRLPEVKRSSPAGNESQMEPRKPARKAGGPIGGRRQKDPKRRVARREGLFSKWIFCLTILTSRALNGPVVKGHPGKSMYLSKVAQKRQGAIETAFRNRGRRFEGHCAFPGSPSAHSPRRANANAQKFTGSPGVPFHAKRDLVSKWNFDRRTNQPQQQT